MDFLDSARRRIELCLGLIEIQPWNLAHGPRAEQFHRYPWRLIRWTSYRPSLLTLRRVEVSLIPEGERVKTHSYEQPVGDERISWPRLCFPAYTLPLFERH